MRRPGYWLAVLATLVVAGLVVTTCDDEVEREVEELEASDPSAGLDLAVALAPSTSTSTTAPPTTTTSRPEPRPPKPKPSRSATPAPAPAVAGWRSLGVFESTCYELRGTTASGSPAGPGSIAVDPRVIPLGSRLRVSGYGEGIAADTGGAIKGRIVDVWKASGCREWGRRSVVVEILQSS